MSNWRDGLMTCGFSRRNCGGKGRPSSSAKLESGQPPALTPLRATLCYQHALSTTTADAAEASLAELLPASTSRASSFGGGGADGIF